MEEPNRTNNIGENLQRTEYEIRHGLEPVMTFKEIGEQIGLKKSMVHRIFHSGCNKLEKWRLFLSKDPTMRQTMIRVNQMNISKR